MSEAKQYKATLVRGGIYVLGDRAFSRGVGQIIDQATKETLERDAVDAVTVGLAGDEDGQSNELRQKFTFEAVPTGAAASTPVARR